MLQPSTALKPTILCCAPDPDARRQLAEKVTGFGHQVLSTGNPRIAAGLLRESQFDLVVVAMSNINLAFMSVIAEARRTSESTPVLVVFTQADYQNFPEGFADLVLCKPSDSTLMRAVRMMTSNNDQLVSAM